MNNRTWDYFELAGKIAISKNDNRGFLLGGIAIRNDGAMVSAVNSISQEPDRRAHAEYRLAQKIDTGSTIYVARVRLLNGEFAMAKPCHACEKILRSKRVRKIYYTISNNEYGVLIP
jgi:tRNA(Arg) A34 adenosine deaminase TadA